MTLDSYNTPEAQELLRLGAERLTRRDRQRRELVVNVVAATVLVVASTLLALVAPWHRTLSPVTLAIVLGVWVAVERVRFPVADGWSYPTMLVFVPALFVLPTPLVPAVAILAVVARAVPALIRGQARPAMVPSFVADAWFAFGPAAVITAGGAQPFAWSHWPLYAAALGAEVFFDGGVSTLRTWLGEGISPRGQLPLLSWVYVLDAALAPLGLLIASAAVARPGLLLIALSPAAVLVAFMRERRERLEQTTALSTAYRGTALLLGDVVEADDEYTGQHSRNVVDLSVAVADALALDATRRRNVEFAALLHDVGKIRVPKEIIRKPGKLNDAEWRIMREHTIVGETMLRQVGGILASIGAYVRSSHERFDGLGYPDGLAGEEIPLEARIVSACDAFSAMTTNRSYRPALPVDEALEELNACSGTQFDPLVVRILDHVIRSSRTVDTRVAPVAVLN